MKMKHLILLLLLALITMVGCLSPDMKGIDPIVDETTPSGKVERGLVSLPDPFGVIDRSGEARNIDLLIPGATQSIEWKVDEHFCFVNIYLYNESKLYRTIAENIDNVGKYDWESEETLDMAHDYEVVVSQHNGTPDENPYLTGDISSKFSMYPSAVELAEALVDRIHPNGTEEEKNAFFISYFKVFQEQGIQFMEKGGRGEYEEPEPLPDPSWVLDPVMLMIYELAQSLDDGDPNNDNDVIAFLKQLTYMNVYSAKARALLVYILGNTFGFTDQTLSNGNWHLVNPSTGSAIDIIVTGVSDTYLDNVTIIFTSGDGQTIIKIEFKVVVSWSGKKKIIQVFKTIYVNGNMEGLPHEENISDIIY